MVLSETFGMFTANGDSHCPGADDGSCDLPQIETSRGTVIVAQNGELYLFNKDANRSGD